MDFEFSEQERMYRDSLREFLKKEYARHRGPRWMPKGHKQSRGHRCTEEVSPIGNRTRPGECPGLRGSPMLFAIFAEEWARSGPAC